MAAVKLDYNSIGKTFFMYVLPSVTAMILSGVYVIVDGIFVGQATGDAGLAAINIAYPIVNITSAIGTGIGAGGAVLMSMSLGAGKEDEAERVLGNTLTFMAVVSFFVTIILAVFSKDLIKLLGASKEIFPLAYEYGIVIMVGAVFNIFGVGIAPVIRNDGNPKKCMLIMICGMITNIVLDWLFIIILGWGLFGAALATIIGQTVTTVLGILHFVLKKSNVKLYIKNIRLNIQRIKNTIVIGISPFGTSLAVAFVAVMFNLRSLGFGGDNGVSIYCTISYAVCPLRLLLEGIGEGMQPLNSFYHGARLWESEKRTLRLGIITAITAGILEFILLTAASPLVPVIFGVSSGLYKSVIEGTKIFAFVFPFLGIERVAISYFYSTGKAKFAAMLIYGDTFLVMPLCIFIIPMILGLKGVWAAYSSVYFILSIFAVIFLLKNAGFKKEFFIYLPKRIKLLFKFFIHRIGEKYRFCRK